MIDYFRKVLAIVSGLTELSADQILYGKKTDEIVDARWIIVKILKEQGFHTTKIALLLNMTQRNVTHIITSFQNRLDQYESLFKSTYQKARNAAGNLYEN
jgi:predicted transcriptional regulator